MTPTLTRGSGLADAPDRIAVVTTTRRSLSRASRIIAPSRKRASDTPNRPSATRAERSGFRVRKRRRLDRWHLRVPSARWRPFFRVASRAASTRYPKGRPYASASREACTLRRCAPSPDRPPRTDRGPRGGRERDVTREERCAPQDSRSSRAATPVPQTPPRATPDLSPPSPSVSRTPATEAGHAPRGLRPRRPGDARALQVRLPAPHPLPPPPRTRGTSFSRFSRLRAHPGEAFFPPRRRRGGVETPNRVQEVFFSLRGATTRRRDDDVASRDAFVALRRYDRARVEHV